MYFSFQQVDKTYDNIIDFVCNILYNTLVRVGSCPYIENVPVGIFFNLNKPTLKFKVVVIDLDNTLHYCIILVFFTHGKNLAHQSNWNIR